MNREILMVENVLVLAALVASPVTIAKADSTDTDSLWEYSFNSVRQCQGAMNDGMESVAACFLGDGINSLFDKGIGLADKRSCSRP
ncbi:hypothetical protein F4212_05495 [Candidatus Poribacteria bacterium]|nr:hypothetical protein [Gammaproteobacteria bacterium]MYF98577.1 hypothetical protein [Candidatus Poribacteria bacterium]